MIPKRFTGTPDGNDPHYYVLGGDHLGAAVAAELEADGVAVTLITEQSPLQTDAIAGNPADVSLLAEAGIDETSRVIVATPSDRRNLLIAQLVSVQFGTTSIVVLINNPDRHDPINEAGHDVVCATTALTSALVNSA